MRVPRKTALRTTFAADFNVANTAVTQAKKAGTAELLFRSAQALGLQPGWIVQDRLFTIQVEGQESYINLARSPLNSDLSASLAKDKYITRIILERHGMQNIPFMQPTSQAEAAEFLGKHKKIIAKPVRGQGTYDIHIITSAKQLQALAITTYILEKYISGQEFRYLILDGKVLGVHRVDYGTSVAVTRARQQISYPVHDWNFSLATSSIQIARALNLSFAAVDYIVDAFGNAHILEVNTTPDITWFHAPTSGPSIDVAGYFLKATLKQQEGKNTMIDKVTM